MTTPDLDKYLERLVKTEAHYRAMLDSGKFAKGIARSHSEAITAICAVLRERREMPEMKTRDNPICPSCGVVGCCVTAHIEADHD